MSITYYSLKTMNHHARFVWLSCLLFFCTILPAQELVFNAFLGDDYIGTMIVTKSETQEGTDYRAVTDLNVKYIISIDLDLRYRALYQDGQLQLTAFEYERNHKLKESCQGQRHGNTFTTQRPGEQLKEELANIHHSLMASYFNEPINADAIFSERWGQNIPLERIANNKYKLTLPDGKESYMTFADGLCQESRIVSGWGTITFRR